MLKNIKSYHGLRDQNRYPGVAANQHLQAFATRAININDQISYNKTTMESGAANRKNYQLLQSQKARLDGLYNIAMTNIETRAAGIHDKLFSTKAQVSLQDAALLPAFLEMYKSSNASLPALTESPRTAAMLAQLAHLKLIPKSTLDSIDRVHSADVMDEKQEIMKDLKMLNDFQREMTTLEGVAVDSATAKRELELEPAPMAD